MGKYLITMADGEKLHVTRKWSDVFMESWFTTIVHQGDKKIRLTNRWIVKVEDDIDGTKS